MAPRQAKSQLFAILLSVSLLVTTSSANVWPTNGVCGARVRYSWTDLTSADKQLYHDAISQAMVTGYHALFTEVHSDFTSFKEAHNTCGMMYWHRRFLFAYEEMLRSLGTRYACITIPYWNYFADYANFLANGCNTFQNCSSFLQDFGGSAGSAVSLQINGWTVNGNCVDGSASPYADYSNFCEKSSMSGSSCAGCIPRGPWSTTTFPSGICYSSLAKYLSLQYGFSWFSQNIHYGMHQQIHSTAKGAMASYTTSADPIFYSHHATVDLIQQLYFNCQIGRTLSDTEKETGTYSFQSCTTTTSNYPNPTSTSTMTMFWNVTVAQPGQARISAESHPRLKRFFAYQQKNYWNYVDATDMGNMSYTYKSDDVFNLLVDNGLSCPQSHTRRLEDPEFVDAPVNSPDEIKATTRAFNVYQDISTAAADNTTSKVEAMEQAETLDCLWYSKNYVVDDFSSQFRAVFGLPSSAHPMCYNRLQDLRFGRRRVKVSDWRDRFDFHLDIMTDQQLARASDITPADEQAMISSAQGSGSASSATAATEAPATTAPMTSTDAPTVSPATTP